MKKALLFVSLFMAGFTQAQDCSKIFISEYVEGRGNNKALEIYNPTPNQINLGEYFVSRYDNGSQTATLLNSVQLRGTIPPYGVYVAVLDKRLPGQGQEAPIWDSLQARADGFYCPDYNDNKTFYWNGNDAVVLFKGTLPTDQPLSYNIQNIPGIEVMDRVGRVGENPGPGTGWSTQAPYNNGNGVIVTVDHSLIRKEGIKKGDLDATGVFNPLAQWDSIPAVVTLPNPETQQPRIYGNWFSLGSHKCDCNPAELSVKDNKMLDLTISPNPSVDGTFKVQSSNLINGIKVYNSLGQLVAEVKTKNTEAALNVGNQPGVYIVRIDTVDGIATKKVIVK